MHEPVPQPEKETDVSKTNKSKQKRIRRKQNKTKLSTLKFIGNNADGIMNKLESLENILKENPSAIFLQETQSNRPGRIKTPSSKKYTWYELHRTQKAPKGEKGGGIALGVLNILEPSWISEGDDDAEAITVEIWIEGFPIRLVCGYGPQVYDKYPRKEKFWAYLNAEVLNATNNGAAFVLQMDGNLWAGKGILKNDPKDQNQNGKYFEKFLQQNPHLTVVNALQLCNGNITRRKITKNAIQETIIDFYVVCDKILPLVTSMTIDENGQHSLTRYKGGVVRTDHNRLDLEINLVFHKEEKHERQTVFNVKNKSCQQKFWEYTSKTIMFTKCFESKDKGIVANFERWQTKFQKSLYACFRKIRVKNVEPKHSKMDVLMNEKKKISKKKIISEDDKEKLDDIEKQVSKECSDKEYDKLVKVLGELETESGGTNSNNVWKEFRKTYPKKSKPLPTGIKNINGKVITNPEEKKKVTIKHFEHRMRRRPKHEDVKEISETNEKTFLMRIEQARINKSPPFNMNELEKVLKSLKTGKSKDFNGYICELFKEGVLGNNLKQSLLMMFNQMKHELIIPECLRTAHVTILHKKNCKLDLNNWRGIFVCSVLRNILMKLVYGRTYENVDKSMTDSQIGARKNKSVRNHLFVLNSIISDVTSSVKKDSIDLNIMDFKQMFDSEELSTCLNALYDSNIQDDMLALIYEANKATHFAVKTPNGITETTKIENKILQGDVLAPLISSNMVDKNIGLPAVNSNYVYLYKNQVIIPPLTMQDDTLGISKCGFQSMEMNNFINTRTNIMGLQFGRDKCVKMHIGKKHVDNNI